MKYLRQFRVPESVERAAEFHAHSASMATITPPPIIVQAHPALADLADGDEMALTVWLGLPVLFAFWVWKTKGMLA